MKNKFKVLSFNHKFYQSRQFKTFCHCAPIDIFINLEDITELDMFLLFRVLIKVYKKNKIYVHNTYFKTN